MTRYLVPLLILTLATPAFGWGAKDKHKSKNDPISQTIKNSADANASAKASAGAAAIAKGGSASSESSGGNVSIDYDSKYQAPSFNFPECGQVASGGFSHFGIGIGNMSKMCELALYAKMLNESGIAYTTYQSKDGITERVPTREIRQVIAEVKDIAFARTGRIYDWLRVIPFLGSML